MEGATLSDANLTNSYFSSSFIGVNGFGSPAESKYSMMQVQTGSCWHIVSVNIQHVKTCFEILCYCGHNAVIGPSIYGGNVLMNICFLKHICS